MQVNFAVYHDRFQWNYSPARAWVKVNADQNRYQCNSAPVGAAKYRCLPQIPINIIVNRDCEVTIYYGIYRQLRSISTRSPPDPGARVECTNVIWDYKYFDQSLNWVYTSNRDQILRNSPPAPAQVLVSTLCDRHHRNTAHARARLGDYTVDRKQYMLRIKHY